MNRPILLPRRLFLFHFLFLLLPILTSSEARTLTSDPGTPVTSADLFVVLQNCLAESSTSFETLAPHIMGIWRSFLDSDLDMNDSCTAMKLQAREGDHRSMIAYGMCFRSGLGRPEDNDKACKWFKMAADQGSPEGNVMYGSTVGVNDTSAGFNYILNSANQGDPFGQFLAGLILRRIAKNDVTRRQAAEFWELASQQGHSFSRVAFGICCAFGVGIPKNRTLAAMYFNSVEHSADAGPLFVCGLALWYRGSEAELSEAARFFRLSADKRYGPGLTWLAWMIENGIGVEKNVVQAEVLYKQAAQGGYPPAQKAMNRLVGSRIEAGGYYYM